MITQYVYGTQYFTSGTDPKTATYTDARQHVVGFIERVDWDARLYPANPANTTGCVVGSFFLTESGTNILLSSYAASGNTQTVAYPRTYGVNNVNASISGTAGNSTTPFLLVNPLALTGSAIITTGSLYDIRVFWKPL